MQSRVDPCRVNEVRISASGGWEQIGFYLNPWHWWLLQGLLSLFTVSIILVLAWCILNIHMNSFSSWEVALLLDHCLQSDCICSLLGYALKF